MGMALINERDRRTLRDLANPVKLTYFTQGESESGIPVEPCPACRDTLQLLEEVSQLSDKISLEVQDFLAEEDRAREMKIDKIPATVIESDGRQLRYFGMPAGYEFALLVEAISLVSRGSTDLSARSKERLQKVDKPVHMQVFVTPT